jgi:hypothetical protein
MGEAAKSSQAAGGATVASLALTVASDITSGNATQAADEFKADRAERAAQFGEMQATLTDTTMRENLNTTLGNIETIRAAANADPTSPTGAVLLEHSEELSDRQRMAAVGTQRTQAADDRASADYLRRAGDFAVSQSYLKAGTDVASSLAKAIPGMG